MMNAIKFTHPGFLALMSYVQDNQLLPGKHCVIAAVHAHGHMLCLNSGSFVPKLQYACQSYSTRRFKVSCGKGSWL